MNGLLDFLGTMRFVAWVYLCVMFLVAAGLAIFDRPRKESAADHEEPLCERQAA